MTILGKWNQIPRRLCPTREPIPNETSERFGTWVKRRHSFTRDAPRHQNTIWMSVRLTDHYYRFRFLKHNMKVQKEVLLPVAANKTDWCLLKASSIKEKLHEHTHAPPGGKGPSAQPASQPARRLRNNQTFSVVGEWLYFAEVVGFRECTPEGLSSNHPYRKITVIVLNSIFRCIFFIFHLLKSLESVRA